MGIINDGKIRFEVLTPQITTDESYYNMAYYDIKTKKVIGPYSSGAGANRADIHFAPTFDPVSNLCYAERYIGKDKTGKEIWRKGYINEDGIFKIVMGEKSKW